MSLRLVSVVPSITESLFDLGIGNQLVAISDYCIHPADEVAKLTKIGGTKNPNIEAIIALKPDLVLLNSEENRRQDAEKLQDAGIELWVTEPRTVAEAIAVLRQMIERFDIPHQTPKIDAIEEAYHQLLAQEKERLPVFVPIWKDPWMTINQDTFIHDVLRVCGGWNVFAERERQYPLKADLGQAEAKSSDGRDVRYPRVTLQEVERHQPEVIILPDEPFIFSAENVQDFVQLDIPAVKHERIYVVDGSLLSWHGTRLVHTLKQIPEFFTLPSR